MTKKILVVEDNDNNLYLMEFLLHGAGFATCNARNGQQAVEMSKTERPDLILMDIQMPDMDGMQATRLIKAEGSTRDIPIVGVSSFAATEVRQLALEAGMMDYIPKPILPAEFLPLIKTYLG
jgi:two-component system cell cycle response regulator DivK